MLGNPQKSRENTPYGVRCFLYGVFAFFIFFGARADETCGTDYTLASTDNIAYFSMLHTRAGECDGGYVPYTANYEISFPVALDLPMKCGTGYYYKNGTCVAYETGVCDNGFVDNAQNSGTMFDYTYTDGCLGGMEPIQTTHNVMHLVDAVSESVRCGVGKYYKNGSCVSYETGGCETGYLNETPVVQDSTFDTTYGGKCLGGYDAILGRHDAMYVIFATTAKCGAGEYPTPNGCASHTTDNCPENYYAVAPVAAFARGDADAEAPCATNYSPYYDMDFCRRYMGANMDEICTPQLACSSGGTTLRTSKGMVRPLYAEQITTPALHFSFANGDICHANMIEGAQGGTINVRYDNETYHIDY